MTGTVAAADGVPIRYEDAGRSEPSLVLVHGGSYDRSYFAASRPVALDLGGHSPCGLGRKDWTVAALSGDVGALDWLNAGGQEGPEHR
jgi:pimeloyl-ACP methyl ester carboxylesterase